MRRIKDLLIHGSLALPIAITVMYLIAGHDYDSISSLKRFANDNLLTCLLCSTSWLYIFSASQIKELKHEYLLAIFILGVAVFDMYNFELYHNISAGVYFLCSSIFSVVKSKTKARKILLLVLNLIGISWLIFNVFLEYYIAYPEMLLIYIYSFFKIINIKNITSNG